jgi:hypothetical protein
MQDDFMFTSLQDPGDDPLSVMLPTLIAPLSAPLWQGETRTFSPTPQEYKFLSSMSQSNQSPTFVHIGSQRGELVGANEAAIAGSVGTEAILLDLSMLSVTILGVGHLKVASVVAERPFRVVRGRRAYDEAATGSTDELRAKATALWDAASGCSRRIQAARLQARLRMLGGAASAALLAIPMADQLELQRSAGGASSTAPARAVRPPSLEDLLEGGVSLDEEIEKAAAAIARARAGDADAAAGVVASDELASHVALRLASGSDEAEHALACRLGESAARWGRAMELIELALAKLRAVEAMSIAVAPDDDGDGA